MIELYNLNEKIVKYRCNELSKGENGNLNILYLNVQSLRNKIDNLKLLVERNNRSKNVPHIIALSEIWIYKNENEYYNLPGYNAYFANRETDRSGGCLIFVLESLDSMMVRCTEYEKSSLLTVKLTKLNINIACVYKNCSSDVRQFINVFEDEVLSLKNTIIVGDFNINLFNESQENTNYLNTIYSNGFVCLNSLNKDMFTRKGNNARTLIDHILTNKLNCHYSICLEDNAISDHRIIQLSIKQSRKLNNTEIKNTIEVLDYALFEEKMLINKVIRKPTFSEFHSCLVNSIQQCTKHVKKSKGNYRQEWMNDELLKLIQNKNKYYKLKMKYINNLYFENKFSTLKVKVRNTINYLKKEFYGFKIEQNINSTKNTWQILKEIIYGKDSKNVIHIGRIIHKEEPIADPLKIANCFNKYFTSVVEAPETTEYVERSSTGSRIPFELNSCDIREVGQAIKELNSASANGPDGISARFLKTYNHILAGPIADFINNCFRSGVFPKELKIGSVIPVYKKGSKEMCSNYRPITKLNTLDKIFEGLILSRLKEFLKSNKIIDEHQFGFIENSNTLAACISCTEFLYENLDKKKFVAMLAIDLSKAFDSVNLQIMIKKLAEIGINGKELQLFESFLLNRQQFVQINKVKSEMIEVHTGVPQGSKLAATLFIIYINSIFKLKLKGTPQFFADDGTFLYEADTYQEIKENIKTDLQMINQWCNIHLLKINLEKTNFIIFNNYKNIPNINDFPGIVFNNTLIKRVEKMKYLGLWVDSKLNWTEHLKNITTKLVPLNFAIYRNRRHIPKKQLWMLYDAYFMSHINYLNPIWNRCPHTKLEEIQRLQNKIIKNILCLPLRTPTTTLYSTRLNIKKTCILQTLITVYKIKNNLIRNNIPLTLSQNPTYSLRNDRNIRSIFFRTTRSAHSIKNYGVRIYNKLPENVKVCTSLIHFKRKVKTLLFQNFNFNI